MASKSVARSESIVAFIPELELLIAEAMDEWKIPGLVITVVQNWEVTLASAEGCITVERLVRAETGPSSGQTGSRGPFQAYNLRV